MFRNSINFLRAAVVVLSALAMPTLTKAALWFAAPVANPTTSPTLTNPGGILQARVPELTGSDPDEGLPYLGDGTRRIRIKSLGVNGTIYYNNVVVADEQVITNYNKNLLTIDPANGAITSSFTYAYIDASNAESAPAAVTIPFRAALAKPCAGTNLLLNPSFEINSTGTDVMYETFVPANWIAKDGDGHYAYHELGWVIPDATSFLGIYNNGDVVHQDVPATVGSTYSMSFYATMHYPLVDNGEVKLQYLDASHNPVGAASVHTITDDWENGEIIAGPHILSLPLAPANVRYIRVSIHNNRTDPTPISESVKVDAFCLVETSNMATNPICSFDSFTGSSTTNILVAKTSSPGFALVFSQPDFNIYFGANASASTSKTNEFEAGGINITNNTGSDISQALVAVKGLGFWTQNIAGTTFKYYTWDATTQSWSGTLGDGRMATMKILGASAGGTTIPMTDIQLMPVKGAASGYTFAEIANSFTATFTDQGTPGGPTVHNAAGTLAVPEMIPFLKLGPLAAGASLNNIRVKVGLFFENGGDAWVNYAADAAASNDWDYFVRIDTQLYGTTYDYGDAPVGYGIARHAPGLCEPAIYIGPSRQDYELSTTGSAATNADDGNTASYNDENSVLNPYALNQTSYSITLPYVNNTGVVATASSWIDWNNNGTFESSEQAAASVTGSTGNVSFTWKTVGSSVTEGTIPAGTLIGPKIVRVRIGTVNSEVVQPAGTAGNGEVEDMVLNAALPVTLVKFDLVRIENAAHLMWETTFETNSDRFEIERSNNGKSWTSIGQVIAGGESNGRRTYLYTDNTPSKGNNYYRLKMIDLDETFAYSQIRSLSFESVDELLVYPNPTSDKLFVQMSNISDIKHISVVNQSGRSLLEIDGAPEKGIDLKGIPSGIYIVKIIRIDGTTVARKVLVKN